jgi:3-oxoacyl-[acyl-carrier protein] reductase
MPDGRELDGMAAIVTGSVRGIGRAVALAFAEAGASVVINGRNSIDAANAVAAEVDAAGGKSLVHMADVADPDGAAGLIDAAVKSFGRLDILVNNVAHRVAQPLIETTFDEWRAVLGSALNSAFLCSRAAIPHLAQHDKGAIVNIGGVSGQAGVKNRTAVATAKAGLSGLTSALAIELADQGITVNCVAPGHIEHHDRDEMSQHFIDRPIPAGRGGTPQEIAAQVRLLCGPNGGFTTGQTFHINGGWYVSIA